jgi:hypothetical protein
MMPATDRQRFAMPKDSLFRHSGFRMNLSGAIPIIGDGQLAEFTNAPPLGNAAADQSTRKQSGSL